MGVGAIAEQGTTALNSTQSVVDNVGHAKTLWQSIHEMLQPVLGHPMVIVLSLALVVGGYFVFRFANQIKLSRLSDHQDGTHAGTLS